MTREEFMTEINERGGVFESLMDGLSANTCVDKTLRKEWAELEAWFSSRPDSFELLEEESLEIDDCDFIAGEVYSELYGEDEDDDDDVTDED